MIVSFHLGNKSSNVRATISQIMYFVQIAQTRRRANLTRLATALEAMIFVKYNFDVKLTELWTPKIFRECYYVARK